MPKGRSVTLGDIVGKLGVLRIACDQCATERRCLVANVVHWYSTDATLLEVLSDICAHCPKRQSISTGTCQAHLPDLVQDR